MGKEDRWNYDKNGNITKFTDARGQFTSYEYDDRNRLTVKTDPALHSEHYEYDEIGNLNRVKDRNGLIRAYLYDGLDRLYVAAYGATEADPYAYVEGAIHTWDKADRLLLVDDTVAGSIARAYDSFDGLIQEVSSQGTIDYTYYPSGLRQSMTVLGQSSISYAYDAANNITSVSRGMESVAFSYNDLGRRASIILPSGISASYIYFKDGQIESITYQNGATFLGDLAYTYNLAGQVESVGGTMARVNLPAAVPLVSHDANNRPFGWGASALQYDTNGSLTEDAGSSTYNYVWDNRGRLSQLKLGGSAVLTFQYDALNRRISKQEASSTAKQYLYDGIQIVQELDGSTPSANLLVGLRLDEIFRRTTSSATEDYLVDGLGSTIALANASGVIQTQYTYEPFGASTIAGAASTNPYQYAGRENDGRNYYYRNRYYSPVLQRFISEDPIGFKGGANLYAYVDGNPVSYRDPLGTNPAAGAMLGAPAGPLGMAAGAIIGGIVGTAAIEEFYKWYVERKEESCDEEWDRAYEKCEEEIKKGCNRDVTGGYKDIHSCARGLVSERCGGNKVEF